MRAYVNLVRAGLRSFFRERQQVFWSFFFPLFFIVIFGTIFGKADRTDVRFKIGMVAPAGLPPQVAWAPDVFRTKIPVFQVKDGPLNELKKQLQEGDLRAIVVFPTDFADRAARHEPSDIRIFTDETQPQMSQAVAGIIENVLTGINSGLATATGAYQPAPTIVQAKAESLAPGPRGGKAKRGFDFILPGILAMTVMQLGLFTAVPLVVMREKGLLKRLRATPLPRATIVASQVTQRVVIGMVQTLVIVVVGVGLYKFQMTGSWPALLALIIFGVLTFVCIGAVLSSIAKTQETAMSMVQMVNFPMMFLSGMLMPLEILPEGLRSMVGVLPATHLATLVRHIMIGAPAQPPINLAVMGAWMIGCLFVASRTFRWE